MNTLVCDWDSLTYVFANIAEHEGLGTSHSRGLHSFDKVRAYGRGAVDRL